MQARGVARYVDLKHFVTDRPGHDRRYAIDATRIRQDLGWRPEHGFDDGLHSTAAWYLEHRAWYQAERLGYDRGRLGLSTSSV
jgi:dTDP-glucose 4,6-dehydratase